MIKNFIIFILCVMCFSATAQVGIGTGTTAPNDKSMLDIVSSTKGVLIPRMTTAQRNAIAPATSTDVNAVNGLLIYNTDTDCYNYWSQDVSSWMTMCQTAGVCDPSTWSEFTIACAQFPAADANTYIIGGSTTGNTITVSVDVTKVGPYSVSIVSNNGVSYTTSGTFTTLGVQNVTVVSSGGAPSSSPINFSVKGNGVEQCTYTKNAGNTFSYTPNCSSGATVTPTMQQGVNNTGTVTVPVTVTGSGNITAWTQTISGVIFTRNATAVTSSTTSITYTYSGTPTGTSINLPLVDAAGSATVCSVNIPSAVGNAVFSCNKVDKFGTYTAGTPLTSANYLKVEFDVTVVGNYPAMTYIGNGMTFTTPAGAFTTTGNIELTFNGTGTPTTAGTYAMTPSDAAKMCVYDLTVGAAFTYNYTCGASNPATIALTAGTATSGSFTVPVTVTGTGNIPSITNTNNGITYTTVAVANANSSTINITVNYTGTPTSAGTSVFTAGPCNYSNTVNAAFAYTYNCGGAVVNPAMVAGVNGSGTITVPVTVTGSGTIPAFTTPLNGVTYSFSGLAATSGTTLITINYNGTPTSTSTNLPLTNSNGTTCNVAITHPYGNAVYTCTGTSSVSSTAKFVATTKLDPANEYINMTLNITTPGNVSITTEDKNGMVFTYTVLVTTTGNTTIKLTPGESTTKFLGLLINTTGSTPNTSEESSNGGNGANNQTATYQPKNALTNANLCSPVSIDVKPLYIDGTGLEMQSFSDNSGNNYWSKNGGALYATEGTMASRMPTDGRIQLDYANMRGLGAAYVTLWGSYLKNVAGAGNTITSYSFISNGSADNHTYTYNNSSSIGNNQRLGPLDPYDQYGTAAPNVNSLARGAHGAGRNGGTFYAEVDNVGISIKIGNFWYKYRLMWDGVSEVSSQEFDVQTTARLVLYGIYNTQPSGNFNSGIDYTANGWRDVIFVETGPIHGNRNIQSYNP